MADMVFLQGTCGSRIVYAGCPVCGRISRQALEKAFAGEDQNSFLVPQQCPVCGLRSESCSNTDTAAWVGRFMSYTEEPESYNTAARQIFERGNPFRSAATPTEHPALDKKIALWKGKLLDLSKRNRMLNYRTARRSTLTITEPGFTELFSRLALDEASLTFQRPVDRDTDLRTFSILSLLETLSCPIPVRIGDIGTEGTILERQQTLKNLRAKSKLAREEQGTNILYLSFGFIEWREKNSAGSPWYKAPLLMMPVSLNLASLNAPYTLSRYDDEIEVNPTLEYFFHEQFGVDLPPFELKDISSLEQYMASIEALTDLHGWKLTREVSLGLLSFLKISMYHDLENNRTRMLENPVIRAITGDIDAVRPIPPEYAAADLDKTAPSEWYQVLNSDSSQQEAILLSKLGVSFVMQGPPGTGKSQTITNIIAEAIAAGKKVLFVSEKAAALQVVLRRLADVHLDDFCLALHSHKANKKDILTQLGRNLKLKRTRVRDGVMDELTELFHDREHLNAYARELHEEIEPLNESLYTVFGKLTQLEAAADIVFVIDDPLGVSEQQFGAMLYAVSNYEKNIRRLGRLSENPWHGTAVTSASQMFQRNFRMHTDGLDRILTSLSENLAVCRERFALTPENTLVGAARVKSMFDTILQTPLFPIEWIDDTKRAHLLSTAEGIQNSTGQYRQDLSAVRKTFADSILSIDLSARMAEADRLTCRLNQIVPDELDEETAFSAASRIALHAGELVRCLKPMLQKYRTAAQLLRLRQDDTLNHMTALAAACQLLSDASPEADWFDPLTLVQAESQLTAAKKHAASFLQKNEAILKNWESDIFIIDTDGMLNRFRTEHLGFFRIFSGSYRTDMRTLRALCKNSAAIIEDVDAIAVLQSIKELNTEKQWFIDNGENLEKLFGSRYKALDTDWTAIKQGLDTVKKIRQLYPGGVVSKETAAILCDHTADSGLLAFAEASAKLDDLCARASVLCPNASDCSVSEELLPLAAEIERICSRLHEISAELEAYTLVPASPAQYLPAVKKAMRVKEMRETLLQHSAMHAAMYGERYHGADTDWESIVTDLKEIDIFCHTTQHSHITPEFMRLFADNAAVRTEIQALNAALTENLEEAISKADWFTGLFDTFSSPEAEDLTVLAQRYTLCANNFTALDRWIDHIETKAECDKLGLEAFTAKIEEGNITDVTNAFKKGFYRQWCDAAIESKPAVRAFRRRIQEERIERFIDMDDKQLTIAQARIREKVIDAFPDQTRLLTADDELRVLQRELQKKRRIMPLRKLFKEIPHLLLTLKPCLMMSPLSVAYFLEAGAYQFDMVIFDEASQIFPQDAVGAIFRGKQVIIAGDSKQLPPTNFFAANTGSEDFDDEDLDEPLGDSILEETASILPSRTLLWHYRSKHEHLIAFSNQEIYGGDLVTFPSSRESEPDSGVEFCYVENGVYESGRSCNIPEAMRCVDLVREHIEKYPQRSLGIIAFSEKQQQAISYQIQRFREQNSQYEFFFSEERDDEFFVKNLENVQGDERDTIIFSICYAKTAEQKAKGRPMAMRFGPLGHSGGERRLNVAITRAKQNIKLVSSILPSDIDLSKTDAEGIRMLRSYIEFARNGTVTLRRSSQEIQPDDFSAAVAAFLEQKGCKVRRQVGCSGYKIDIAVEHPENDGRFVAGIECDGPSYISAKTARDRDHLLRSILESMGWNIYRVWSTEWQNNPDIEGEKLLDFIHAAMERAAEEPRSTENTKTEEPIADMMDEIDSAGQEDLCDFAVYVEADWSHARENSVESQLMHIIAIEQPVHTEVLYGRMTGALGRKMVTPVVRRTVDSVLEALKEAGKVQNSREFWTLSGFSDIRVRTPAPGAQPRQIAHIPAEEIILAMLTVAKNTFGLSDEGLMDETAAILGYARRGSRITENLRAVLNSLLAEGRLHLIDGKIQI